MGVGVVLVHDMNLHFAEAAREGHLIGGRQVMVAEQQKLVGEEGLVDRRKRRVVDRRSGEPDDLRAEPARQGTQIEGTDGGLDGGGGGHGILLDSVERPSLRIGRQLRRGGPRRWTGCSAPLSSPWRSRGTGSLSRANTIVISGEARDARRRMNRGSVHEQ